MYKVTESGIEVGKPWNLTLRDQVELFMDISKNTNRDVGTTAMPAGFRVFDATEEESVSEMTAEEILEQFRTTGKLPS